MGCGATKLLVSKRCPSTSESEATACARPAIARSTVHGSGQLIMGQYHLSGRKEDIMGQGSFSICYKGVDSQTGEAVAIKMYKDEGCKRAYPPDENTLRKFERQVAVLQQLQEPFAPPADPTLWNDELADVNPSDLFVRLIDYSKDALGNPGPDPADGNLYVITELAQYSLKTYLKLQRSESQPLPKDIIQTITKEIILVVAGLHAKGFVHLDLKPENLMRFSEGRLKLIDVDGCVAVGIDLLIDDPSVSFSPCYCSPDWAQFVVDGKSINIDPSLDVWSVGMTLCDLVGQEPVMKPAYATFARGNRKRSDAARQYMKYLSRAKSFPLPLGIDDGLSDLLTNWLLVSDATRRRTLAESLSSPYVADIDQMVRLPTRLTLLAEQGP